ncbi:alpha-L-rhamnosidase [Arthrobacter pascens]|uniref:alpha-L-rhamnosidase n=1 Tax=Arthrobacter pascens TaxID=1677 RepID=UPI0027900FD7|nr:alpha-L-rhamnosidase [Arthrobacter pascens]MDQ0679664.1 alpha-L-rhamnosidase [Arthrobacter pascens]
MSATITRVRFEHHENARLGIEEARPRISWQLGEAPEGFVQTAAHVEVSLGVPGMETDTSLHVLRGEAQVLVPWPARPLVSRERATVRVQVQGPDGWGPWSEPASVEAGLLEPGDWVAGLVGPAWDEEPGTLRRPGRVRTEFVLPPDLVSARLYLSGHGLVEAEINGRRVGDEEFTPGWTSYSHRLRYAAFDVTNLLEAGQNAIGVWLADGWWRGRIGFEGGVWDYYGTDLSALVQLEAVTADGIRHTICSDKNWQAGFGPILTASLYDGETFDARLHDPAWSRPGWDLDGWTPARTTALVASVLVAPTGPPVRCIEELVPVSVEDKGEGRWLLDFGQNHSGRLRLRATGPAGHVITVRHAEVLQAGEIYTRTLREAAATDVLVLGGKELEWEPRFTIHGYRYAEVSGWQGALEPGDVVSRVLHSDMERTGWFRCSDPELERLHENVLWSLRSNFVDIPTDCPQRDERLGWTGDIQVFTATAAFLYNVTGMLSSWLRDLALQQQKIGTVPFYVPWIPLGGWAQLPPDPVAVWDDVAVLTPDVLYQRTGDLQLLHRQYPSARSYVEQVAAKAGPTLLCEGWTQLGDWLDPAAPPESPFEATTEPGLVATAYFAYSARRLAAVASLLGEDDDAARYTDLAEKVVAAFVTRYLTDEGRATSDTQTAYALISAFDLYPNMQSRQAGADRLAQLVREAGGRISTGFAGTPVVTDALTRDGHLTEAYLMVQATGYPSWLYSITMGATTIWERWDSMLADGTVNPGDMTSFNHYALGAVADWMHRVVAGLEAADTAYRRIRFAPRPGGTLTSAGATHRTPYGVARIDWTLEDGALRTTVVVPVGARGIVELPGAEPVEVGHGIHEFAQEYVP